MTTTWSDAKARWAAAQEALVEQFRPKYLAEAQRFADELRPLFECGALYGHRDSSLCDADQAMDRLEALCRARFGIEVRDAPDESELVEEDYDTARMILAVSPSAEAAYVPGQEIDSFNASYACAWDVLAFARARGFYTAPPEENPPEDVTAWARDVVA